MLVKIPPKNYPTVNSRPFRACIISGFFNSTAGNSQGYELDIILWMCYYSNRGEKMNDLDMDKFYAILNKLLMELDSIDNPKVIKLLKAYNVRVSRQGENVKVEWDWTQLKTKDPFLYFRY